MAQKRPSPRSTSDRFVVVDKHIMAEEAFYLPKNKQRDPDAPDGAFGLSIHEGMDGVIRPVVLTEGGLKEVAMKGEVTGGTPEYETAYGFSAFPRPGEEKRNGATLIYVDFDSTESPKAQYQWSEAQNNYYRSNLDTDGLEKTFKKDAPGGYPGLGQDRSVRARAYRMESELNGADVRMDFGLDRSKGKNFLGLAKSFVGYLFGVQTDTGKMVVSKNFDLMGDADKHTIDGSTDVIGSLSEWFPGVTKYADGTDLTPEKCAYTYNQLYKKVGDTYWQRKITGRIQMSWFPQFEASVDTTGVDVSGVLQRVINVATHLKKDIQVPEGGFLYKYPVFVKSNVIVHHEGVSTRIIANISAYEGRCGYCIGNSREWNELMVERRRAEGSFGPIEDFGEPGRPAFKDVPAKTGFTLKPDSEYINVRHAGVRNVFIDFDYTGKVDIWGGYGVQLNNAYDCHVYGLTTRNATQSWGIGSDVGLKTPGCVGCTVTENFVIAPCRHWSYYTTGFIANSNDCHGNTLYSNEEVDPNSNDGSLFAFNYCENCSVRNLNGRVGRSKTSEGILFNNSRACKADGFDIKNAKFAVSTYFTLDEDNNNAIYIDSAKPNIIINGNTTACDYNVSTLSKYDRFENIKGKALIASVRFGNINGTNNYIGKTVEQDTIQEPDGENPGWGINHNVFEAYIGSLAQLYDQNKGSTQRIAFFDTDGKPKPSALSLADIVEAHAISYNDLLALKLANLLPQNQRFDIVGYGIRVTTRYQNTFYPDFYIYNVSEYASDKFQAIKNLLSGGTDFALADAIGTTERIAVIGANGRLKPASIGIEDIIGAIPVTYNDLLALVLSDLLPQNKWFDITDRGVRVKSRFVDTFYPEAYIYNKVIYSSNTDYPEDIQELLGVTTDIAYGFAVGDGNRLTYFDADGRLCVSDVTLESLAQGPSGNPETFSNTELNDKRAAGSLEPLSLYNNSTTSGQQASKGADSWRPGSIIPKTATAAQKIQQMQATGDTFDSLHSSDMWFYDGKGIVMRDRNPAGSNNGQNWCRLYVQDGSVRVENI